MPHVHFYKKNIMKCSKLRNLYSTISLELILILFPTRTIQTISIIHFINFQVFDGDSTGIKLYQGPDFTEADPTNFMLSADSGEMQIRFKTDASKNARGFSAVFSADCPPLQAGEGA